MGWEENKKENECKALFLSLKKVFFKLLIVEKEGSLINCRDKQNKS